MATSNRRLSGYLRGNEVDSSQDEVEERIFDYHAALGHSPAIDCPLQRLAQESLTAFGSHGLTARYVEVNYRIARAVRDLAACYPDHWLVESNPTFTWPLRHHARHQGLHPISDR